MKKFLMLATLAFAHVGAWAQSVAIPEAFKTPIPIYRAEQIPSLCAERIKNAQTLRKALAKAKNAEGFLEKWNHLSLSLDAFNGQMGLLANVSPDKALRTHAEACGLKLSALTVEVFQDPQIYALVKAVKPADAIEAKLQDDLIYGFERSGAALPPAQRQTFKKLRAQLEKLDQDFSRNIRDNPTKVLMSEEEMAGLPSSYLQAQKKNEKGQYVLGFEYPQYVPFMASAHSSAARKKYYIAFQNRGTDKNPKILDEIVALRTQIAALFGFESFADYALQKRVAQNAQKVLDFLAQVRQKVNEGEKNDLDKLQAFRAQTENIDLAAAKITRWDLNYWEEAYKKAHFNVDQELLRDHMLSEPTINWALNMTAKLYGVTLAPRQVPVWHSDVRYFDVIDNASQKFISGIFIDPYPREGKYGHAAAFPVQGSSTLGGQLPISVLVSNFNRKGFNWDEMITLLHEFGHVMHGALSNTRFVDHAGTSVETDFVEAPSQMYEEWGRHFQTLKTLTEACQTCQPFTQEMVDKIHEAEKFGKGIFYARQWLYASYDMALYGKAYAKKPLGVMKVWDEMESATQIGHVPGTAFPGNFSHIAGGYAAGYYGYMWSLVNALDMASAFKGNWLDATIGKKFRDTVLAQGSQKTGAELTFAFLEREPQPDAFFKEITGK